MKIKPKLVGKYGSVCVTLILFICNCCARVSRVFIVKISRLCSMASRDTFLAEKGVLFTFWFFRIYKRKWIITEGLEQTLSRTNVSGD